jgi:hypothetical protein
MQYNNPPLKSVRASAATVCSLCETFPLQQLIYIFFLCVDVNLFHRALLLQWLL